MYGKYTIYGGKPDELSTNTTDVLAVTVVPFSAISYHILVELFTFPNA